MDYDMEAYQRYRDEISQYSDQQLSFRALARIFSNQAGLGVSFEYNRVLIDTLLDRANKAPGDELAQPQLGRK